MKRIARLTLGILLLTTTLIAQDAKPQKKATTADAPKQAAQKTQKLTAKDKQGYAVGVQLGLDVARQGMDLNRDFVLQGMKDALRGGKFLMTVDEMNAILTNLQKEQREKIVAAVTAFGEKNKKDEAAFFATNKAKDGVVTLASGLQYKVLKTADGKKPSLEDKVVCNYRGTLLDGTEVDSSYKRNAPSTFPLKGVIKGWTEAMQLMPVGSKWQIFVPSSLAYGDRGDAGRGIGPNAALIFEVELLSIQDKPQSASSSK